MNTSIFMCKKCSKLQKRVLNINLTNNSELNNVHYSSSIYDSNIQEYHNINDYTIMKTFDNYTRDSNNKSNDELQIIDYPYNNLNDTSSFCSKTTIKKYNLEEKFNSSEKNTTRRISHQGKNIFNLFNNYNNQVINNKKKINNLLISCRKGKLQNKFKNYNYYFLKKKNKDKVMKLTAKPNINEFNSKIKKNNNKNSKNVYNSHLLKKNCISKKKNILHVSYNKHPIKNIYDSNQRSHKTINEHSNKDNLSIFQQKETSTKKKEYIYTEELFSKKKLILNKNVNKKSGINFGAKNVLKLTDSAGNLKNLKKKEMLIKSKSSKVILPDTTHSSQTRKTKNIINIKTQKKLI